MVPAPKREWSVARKRGVDLVLAGGLVLVTLPLLVAAAVATAVALRSWPFFTQERIGRGGRRFRFVKLRTLPRHAPPYATKYEVQDLPLPRVSRALRRLHLDELPQLYLVLSGHMSLVGPRPEMPYLHDRFEPAFAALRTSVRPGCTGLWQIGEHCTGMIHEHPEFDEYYLTRWTPRFDFWIMGRTVRQFLPFRHRLVSVHDVPVWATTGPAPVPRRRETVSEPAFERQFEVSEV